MPTADVNLIAVLVAALVTFGLTVVWYSPILFGRQWMEARGYTADQVQDLRKRGMVKGYPLSLVAYVVLAYVFALLVGYTNAVGPAQGLWLGFLVWLGFVATTGLTIYAFTQTRFLSYVIDAANQLAYLLLTGLILASWR